MAIEGLEIAPGGIGSGEAQIFKTPFTERAFMMKNEQERLNKAKEQELSSKEAERIADELAKIEMDKIHVPDSKKISAMYEDVVSQYADWKSTTNRDEKRQKRIEIENKKKDLLLKVNASKQRAEEVKKVGSSLLGRNRDEVGEDFVLEWETMSKTPTDEYEYSPLKFVGKGKPEFLVDIESKIADNSMSPESTRIYAGKVGDKDVIMTENGQQLYRPVFIENSIDYYSKSPSYRDSLVKLYKDEYVKNGGDFKDEDAFAMYAVNKRFDVLKETKDITKKSASQLGGNNIVNFNNGGKQLTPISGINAMKGDEDVYDFMVTNQYTSTGESIKTGVQKVVPTIGSPLTVNGIVDISTQNFYDENGRLQKGKKTSLNGEVLGFVVKPVYIDENGDPQLWPEKTIRLKSDGTKEEIISKPPQNLQYVKLALVQRKGQTKPTSIPWDDIPITFKNRRDIQPIAAEFEKREGVGSMSGKSKGVTPAKNSGKKSISGF